MLKRMLRTGMLGMPLCMSQPALAGDPLDPHAPEWELRKQKLGIQVYTRTIDGSSFEAFQGRSILKARIPSLVAVMSHAESCVDWVHQCSGARNLDKVTPQSSHQYGVNQFPWPAQNRDYVIHITTQYDPERSIFRVNTNAVDEKLPLTENIRINQMKIRYLLQRVDDQYTQVYWTQHTEPGGWLPGWMVNMLLVDIPFNSLVSLEKVASQARFRTAEFDINNVGEIVDWKVKDW
jgi:hypothetical protein